MTLGGQMANIILRGSHSLKILNIVLIHHHHHHHYLNILYMNINMHNFFKANT
jgi:hypothetical protein